MLCRAVPAVLMQVGSISSWQVRGLLVLLLLLLLLAAMLSGQGVRARCPGKEMLPVARLHCLPFQSFVSAAAAAGAGCIALLVTSGAAPAAAVLPHAEGLATLVLAGILRWRLPGSVLTADFLTSEDKLWLLQQLQPSLAAADCPAADAAIVAEADSSAWGCHHNTTARQSPADPAGGSSGSNSRRDGAPQTQQQQQQPPQGRAEAASEGSHLKAASVLVPPASSLPQQHHHQQQQELQAAHLGDKQAMQLSAVQQLKLTMQNRLIWYLMLLKALKVRGGRVLTLLCMGCCKVDIDFLAKPLQVASKAVAYQTIATGCLHRLAQSSGHTTTQSS